MADHFIENEKAAFQRRSLLLGGLVLPWMSEAASAAEGGARKGGTLVAAVYPEPPILTTAINNFYTVLAVSTNIYEGLLTYGASSEPLPGLAESWSVSPDNLSLTFRLRRGVEWHDGKDFTSADVRYSALEIWRKLHPRGRGTFVSLVDVETPDANTAIFRLSRPSPIILSALGSADSQVLPAHLYEGTNPVANPHNVRPVGTGPFVFSAWRKGEYIELSRNEHYWNGARPYLDKLIFRVIADPASRAAALETGEVQYAPYSPIPLSDLPRFKADSSLAIESRGYSYESPLFFFEFNLKDPIVKDRRVRQAFAHAIDRNGLVATVWRGVGRPAVGPIPSQLAPFFTDDVPRYEFNPKKAEALLDEAGYPRQAGGARFTINHVYSAGEAEFETAVQYIRQNLARVGIDLRPQTGDVASISRRVYTDYDFSTRSGKFASMIDPAMGLYRLYWSKSYVKGVANTNASGYATDEMDRIIEAVQSEPDSAKRVALFHWWQRLAMTDLPTIPLVELSYFSVLNRRVKGLSGNPDAVTASLQDVWLSER